MLHQWRRQTPFTCLVLMCCAEVKLFVWVCIFLCSTLTCDRVYKHTAHMNLARALCCRCTKEWLGLNCTGIWRWLSDKCSSQACNRSSPEATLQLQWHNRSARGANMMIFGRAMQRLWVGASPGAVFQLTSRSAGWFLVRNNIEHLPTKSNQPKLGCATST